MKHAPTAEQIDEFYGYVEDYVVMLNLQDWRVERSRKKAAKGAMADVGISYADRLAVVSIGKDWGQPITSELLAATARHEAIHIFLVPLIEAAKTRDETLIASVEHSVVVLLEKILA